MNKERVVVALGYFLGHSLVMKDDVGMKAVRVLMKETGVTDEAMATRLVADLDGILGQQGKDAALEMATAFMEGLVAVGKGVPK